MRKRIGTVLAGLLLSLPLLSAVGSRLVLRGSQDGVAQPAGMAPAAHKAGTVEPSTGTPCRRSAADRLDAPTVGPNTGCNLRLVKRRPADPTIWL